MNPHNVYVVDWMTRIVREHVPIHNLTLRIAVRVQINVRQEKNVSMDHASVRVTFVVRSVPIRRWIRKIVEHVTISATLIKFVVPDTARTLRDRAFKPTKIAVDVEAHVRRWKTAVQGIVRI